MTEPTTPPAGWYPDPGGGQLRWWDGMAWTPQFAPLPVAADAPQVSFVGDRRRVYSHDLLYVADVAGAKIGRVNLETGKVTMDQPDRRAEFDDFVARWREENGQPVGSVGDRDELVASDLVGGDSVPWQDLAQNRPGQGVRERAIELKAEAPVKTFVARMFGVHTDERAFRMGAEGEEEVAWRLRKLGDGWRVLHSVPVGENDSDIDHVVIGPAGVFTLNTKHHRGKKVWVAEQAFMVNGHKTNYLRNSRFEAARASKLLTSACGFDVAVEPVIVVMAAELTIKAQPVGVHVVGRRRIRQWLQQRPAVLSPAAVEAIYEVARRDTSWRRR